MKKKSILAVEPVKPKTQEKDVLTVQEATIRDEKHLIMTQMYVVEVMRLLDERQEEEAKTVRVLKDFKKYHLAKMFPEGMRGGSR